jgi:NodT family efflux transporter outer membrane factor (OMF) lipoprotein
MRRAMLLRPVALGCALALVGCATAPSAPEAGPRLQVPTAYRNADAAAAPPAVDASPDAVARRRHAAWWQVFENTTLDRLVDQGLANNRDLRIVTLQLAQARLRLDQVEADGKPKLSVPLLAAMQAPGGQVGAVPVSRSMSRPQTSLQSSVQGSWQPDLWGERQGMADSAQAQVWRAVYERENVQRNLIGNIVGGYINYLLANDAIHLARESESTGRTIVGLLEQRLAAGDATADELEQKRSALYAQQMVLPGLELQREEARNTLAVMLGATPSALELPPDAGLDGLATPDVAADLPSALLFQRPDIRAVEARMRAAKADIAVARARMLPAVNLSGQLGLSGAGVLQLLQPQSLFWNLISGMTASIFDGGRKEADKALSQAAYEEMVETYARTVLQAVREVEGALVGLRYARRQLALQQQMTASTLNTFKISAAAYQVGSLDSTTLMEVRKTYQRALEDERGRRADALRAQVALYLALGGGALPAGATGELAPLAASADVELFTGESASRPPTGGWQVGLTGVVHQSTIGAVWRDLKVRHPQDMQGRALRVRRSGSIDSPDELPQAWHQLAVTRFASRDEAERLCRQLRDAQQSCVVEPVAPELLAKGSR